MVTGVTPAPPMWWSPFEPALAFVDLDCPGSVWIVAPDAVTVVSPCGASFPVNFPAASPAKWGKLLSPQENSLVGPSWLPSAQENSLILGLYQGISAGGDQRKVAV